MRWYLLSALCSGSHCRSARTGGDKHQMRDQQAGAAYATVHQAPVLQLNRQLPIAQKLHNLCCPNHGVPRDIATLKNLASETLRIDNKRKLLPKASRLLGSRVICRDIQYCVYSAHKSRGADQRAACDSRVAQSGPSVSIKRCADLASVVCDGVDGHRGRPFPEWKRYRTMAEQQRSWLQQLQ